MNLAGKRLSSQNQPTWNNLEGPALVRRASQGSMEVKKRVGVGRSLQLQRLPLGNEMSFFQSIIQLSIGLKIIVSTTRVKKMVRFLSVVESAPVNIY